MANENESIPSLTLEVLKDIRGEIRTLRVETNQRLDHMTERMDHMTERMDHMTERMDHMTERIDTMGGQIEQLTGRFDHFLEFGGEYHRSLDGRITRLENTVFSAQPPR